METREEKIGPVAIIETREGLRVAVYVVRTFAIIETRLGPPVENLIRIEIKTDGGQHVRVDSHFPEVATIYGTREPTLCSVVKGSLNLERLETLELT